MEDQATHQPAANGMEEETVEKRDNAGSWPGALMINEKYAEQMLVRFNENEVNFFWEGGEGGQLFLL